jgi:hypothetical protein
VNGVDGAWVRDGCRNEHHKVSTGRTIWELAHMDLLMSSGGFKKLYSAVRGFPVSGTRETGSVAAVGDAMARARGFYPKRARCLQTSAAMVRLLRRRGVDGHVVSDRADLRSIYDVLDEL